MSDIFFYEHGADPKPAEEVRIEQVSARPYPDGRRVMLKLVVTPFAERPSLDLEVLNAEGQTVAAADILETMTTDMELTLHLRGPRPTGEHTLCVRLYYPDRPPQDSHEVTFAVTPQREALS